MNVQATIALLNGNKSDLSLSSSTGSTTAPNNIKTNSTNWGKPLPTLSNNIDNNNNNSNTHTSYDRSRISLEKKVPTTRTNLDMYIEELTSMYQDLLNENTLANNKIKKLEADVEIYSCDSTKVRDYEIRVEYLAQKLEQISEERDELEKELSTYKDRHGSLATPVSHEFGPDALKDCTNDNESPTPPMEIIDDENNNNNTQRQSQHPHHEDEYFNDILDAYEHQSENMDDLHQKYQEQIETMEQAMKEYDQGMKMAIQKYVADTEEQRLKNKTLQSMVKKQEELITKLEDRLKENYPMLSSDLTASNNELPMEQHDEVLLREQVELQRIELESKRDLLTQLLNEREELLKKVNGANQQSTTPGRSHQQRRSASHRSSIDVLAELAKTNIPTSASSLSLRSLPDNGRSTPPPFAAPRTPLPPLPSSNGDYNSSDRHSFSSHKSSANNSLVSYSRSSSLPSPNSCGSNEMVHPHQKQQHKQYKHFDEPFERTTSLMNSLTTEQDNTHISNSYWKRQ
ncbi:hypothetical protein BJ944DRAFT_265073 [Cunninghamella echinulata]|nr:hypothetical protein BJ944DRAFT_265073 [Cunninghamella echinulata]